ncbi:MAG: hypothetical protein Q8755_03425, partial [Candidatus Phytoplasma australasiaticum]|nr:hypothetical protein [Candidatus Phytoplasma australasiaticum]
RHFCINLSLMVGIPKGRVFLLSLGMKILLTGFGCIDLFEAHIQMKGVSLHLDYFNGSHPWLFLLAIYLNKCLIN